MKRAIRNLALVGVAEITLLMGLVLFLKLGGMVLWEDVNMGPVTWVMRMVNGIVN